MLNIGYACLIVGVNSIHFQTITKRSLTKDRLYEVISHNLKTLDKMIEYNKNNNIKLFRISSDLIPFGSSTLNTFPWDKDFINEFNKLAYKIKSFNMRFSFHPGQYTVLNSPSIEVMESAIEDLKYHQKLISLLGGNQENKMILHVGGVYKDKEASMNRFIERYNDLPKKIKTHLVIENDDHYYTLEDVMKISNITNIPVVFDLFHHQILPSYSGYSVNQLINMVSQTWKKEDGRMKIHYSQHDENKSKGAHSLTINSGVFLNVFSSLINEDLDIMLEVKDKNISAIKCINLLASKKDIYRLEEEWARYKYLILERSHSSYQKIRELLKNKDGYPVKEFYFFIEHAMSKTPTLGSINNAISHIWGYFKRIANEKEKKLIQKSIEKININLVNSISVKRKLFSLAIKYNQTYLLNSYYFFF